MKVDSKWKKDFPILKREINGKKLHYLDNAATSQVPVAVLDSVYDFETKHRSNIHRGVHTLSEEATEMYENSRKKIAKFVNAVVPDEIVFVRNTTEAVNLTAYSWGMKNINEGDVILLSEVEHHSNLVPWQVLAKKRKAHLLFIPVNEEGELQIKKVNVDWSKVKLVSFSYISNVLGTVNDVKGIVRAVKKKFKNSGDIPKFFIDGAQAMVHVPVNVQKLGVDFFAFSGHKMCGPMGIGVLWVKRELLEKMDPFLTGGGMIQFVERDSSTYGDYPGKFEGGTPNISGAIGLGAACDYLSSIGMDVIYAHSKVLVKYALEKLAKINDVIIYGSKNVDKKAGLISFNLKGIPAHDLAAILDTEGVAIRSGHHCVMPWHKKQKITTSARMSFCLYNTSEDIDALIKGINKSIKIFNGAY